MLWLCADRQPPKSAEIGDVGDGSVSAKMAWTRLWGGVLLTVATLISVGAVTPAWSATITGSNRAVVKLTRPATGAIHQAGRVRGALGSGGVATTARFAGSGMTYKVHCVLVYKRGRIRLRGTVRASVSGDGYAIRGRVSVVSGDGVFAEARGRLKVTGSGTSDFSRAVYDFVGTVRY